MEVHHHAHDPAAPHHHKKNWKNYFWEFLMLFLAVFCGFLAEWQLEHSIEQQREKQFVELLIEDLKNDEAIIENQIADEKKGILLLDTLVLKLNEKTRDSKNAIDLYYLARYAPRQSPLTINTRTFEQLKYSGSFRLIRQIQASNNIMKYYEKVPQIRMLESLHQQEQIEYQKLAAKVFNAEIFLKMEGEGTVINRTLPNIQLPFIEQKSLGELAVFSIYIRGTKKGISSSLVELKKMNKELILYLQKTYKME